MQFDQKTLVRIGTAIVVVIVGALFQTGRFNQADSIYVWRILAGSSVGLNRAATRLVPQRAKFTCKHADIFI